jgi:hypothetical protein
MSIIYSGQPIVNTTIDGSSNTALLTALQNVLVSAGWTVVQNGSSNGIWRLRSVATPQGLQGDLWMRNATGAGTTLILDVTSPAATSYNTATQSMSDSNLVTGAGFTYQVIASSFYFYLFRAATPCPTAQSFFMSVPYVPSFLSGLVTSLIVASFGQDPYEITKGLFTTANSYGFSCLNGQGASGQKWDIFSTTSNAKPVWFDGSCEFYEPRIMSYQTGAGGVNTGSLQAVGYQWDALVLNYPLPRGTIISYDGGSWYVLTESTDPGLMVKVA